MNRPSRAQQNLLEFIEAFVRQHGYGPSYREIMNSLDYKSVSTVAIHVNGLISKGVLKKEGRSARSLQVVAQSKPESASKTPKPDLLEKIEAFAAHPKTTQDDLEEMARVFQNLGLADAEQKVRSYLTSLE